MQGKRSHIAR